MALKLKLIDDWRKSYKLYSMWIALAIMGLSILDVLLHQFTYTEVPRWIFYMTGPGVAIARVIQQFFETETYDGAVE